MDRYDAVALTKELARQGEELSIAAEGAKLLSVCTMQSSGKNPGNSEAAVVFAQDGKTKIKAIQWDGTEWIFGGTQELLETELEAVTVTALNGYLVVLFRESEFGMVKFYSMYGTELTLLATDLWTDDSPYNITAAWVPERTCRVTQTGMGSNDWYDRGQVVVSWLNDQGALKLEALSLESTWNEAEGEPNYSVKSIHTATVAAGEYEGIHYSQTAYDLIQALRGEKDPGAKVDMILGYEGTEESKMALFQGMVTESLNGSLHQLQRMGVSIDLVMEIYKAEQGVKGDGTNLSASRNKKAVIDRLTPGLPKAQTEALYAAFGVSEKVWSEPKGLPVPTK